MKPADLSVRILPDIREEIHGLREEAATSPVMDLSFRRIADLSYGDQRAMIRY